uniref:Uncharacterized protein n=1 Tax=Romanomermis culicivorax TaxID=13658 RepID=A0A915JBA5_ROMCU
MSDCRNDVVGLVKKRRAAGKRSRTFFGEETDSARQLVQCRGYVDVSNDAVRVEVNCFYDGVFVFLLLRRGLCFSFVDRSGRVPRRAYIPAQSSAPSKEITMVCWPSTRENRAVQSSGVAVNVSKTNIVLFGNAS